MKIKSNNISLSFPKIETPRIKLGSSGNYNREEYNKSFAEFIDYLKSKEKNVIDDDIKEKYKSLIEYLGNIRETFFSHRFIIKNIETVGGGEYISLLEDIDKKYSDIILSSDTSHQKHIHDDVFEMGDAVCIRYGKGEDDYVSISKEEYKEIKSIMENSKLDDGLVYKKLGSYLSDLRSKKENIKEIFDYKDMGEDIPEGVRKILLRGISESEISENNINEIEDNIEIYISRKKDEKDYLEKSLKYLRKFRSNIRNLGDSSVDRLIEETGIENSQESILPVDSNDRDQAKKILEDVFKRAKEENANPEDFLRKTLENYSGKTIPLMLIYAGLQNRGISNRFKRELTNAILSSDEYSDIISNIEFPKDASSLLEEEEFVDLKEVSNRIPKLLSEIIEIMELKHPPSERIEKNIEIDLNNYRKEKQKGLGGEAEIKGKYYHDYRDDFVDKIEEIMDMYNKYKKIYKIKDREYMFSTGEYHLLGDDEQAEKLNIKLKEKEDALGEFLHKGEYYKTISEVSNCYQKIQNRLFGVSASFGGQRKHRIHSEEEFNKIYNMIEWLRDEDNEGARIFLSSILHRDSGTPFEKIYEKFDNNVLESLPNIKKDINDLKKSYKVSYDKENDSAINSINRILEKGSHGSWFDSFSRYYDVVSSVSDIPVIKKYIVDFADSIVKFRFGVWEKIVNNKFKLDDIGSISGGSFPYVGAYSHENKLYCVFAVDSREGTLGNFGSLLISAGLKEGEDHIFIDINNSETKQVVYDDLPGLDDFLKEYDEEVKNMGLPASSETTPEDMGKIIDDLLGKEERNVMEDIEQGEFYEEPDKVDDFQIHEREPGLPGEESEDDLSYEAPTYHSEESESPGEESVIDLLFEDPAHRSYLGEEEKEETGYAGEGEEGFGWEDEATLNLSEDDDPKIGKRIRIAKVIKLAEMVDPEFHMFDPEELGVFGIVGVGIEIEVMRKLVASGVIFDLFQSDYMEVVSPGMFQ